jgi:hypothetical protein
MLMKTAPQIDLTPKGRDPIKFSLAMRQAAERARQDEPYIKAMQSNVRETVYEASRIGRG